VAGYVVSNIIVLIGTTLLIWAEIKKKDNDFNIKFLGATITAIAMLSFLFSYYASDDYHSLIIASVTTLYWVVVSLRLWRRRRDSNAR